MLLRMKHALLFATWGICLLLPLQIFAQDLGGDNQATDSIKTSSSIESGQLLETVDSIESPDSLEPSNQIENLNHVVTWVRKNSNGKPSSIGIKFPAAGLRHLPEDSFEIVAPFPKVVHLPFTHLYFVWEPHGHEPPGIYDLPHFDIHFYIIPNSERRQITCAGADEAKCMKTPPSNMIPADYLPTPAGVPKMGWHWVDSLAPEFHGHTFTSTMIYGYYNGRLAFYEPMVTIDFLRTHPHFAASIRQPQKFPKPGYYPTAYSVIYRSVSDTFEVALTNLVYRH